ncbi:MAG: RNA 2',3'-cyclic phosphodiesterase [Actinomycetales bacterium]
MNLFVAVRPSSAAVRDLEGAVAAARAGAGDDLRWTASDGWHLTLAFLGRVDEAHRAELLPRLERAARRHAPMTLSLDGAGHFGSHVLFSHVAGDVAALRALAASVVAAARRAGIAVDELPFRPHLTLARSRGRASLRPLAALLEGHTGPAWPVPEMLLMESTPSGLGGRPPTYTALASFPLGGRPS